MKNANMNKIILKDNENKCNHTKIMNQYNNTRLTKSAKRSQIKIRMPP
jgi:hypothetical protein